MRSDGDRLRRFAWLLDELIRIPGTQQRVGLDALIGLVPGVGDFAFSPARRGAPAPHRGLPPWGATSSDAAAPPRRSG